MNVDENRWVTVLKDLKQAQLLKAGKSPDVLPAVIMEKDERVWITAIVPDPKTLGANPPDPRDVALWAATLLRISIDPDLVVFICDGYCKDKPLDTETLENLNLEEFSSVSLEDEFSRGVENVKEAMICTLINKEKEFSVVSMPYHYGGGDIILWENKISMDGGGGHVRDCMTMMMDEPLMIERPDMIAFGIENKMSRQEQFYHAGRAAIHILETKGFTIINTMPSPVTGEENA